MKIYRYDTGTGVYQGEDFLDPAEFAREAGVTRVPPPEAVPGARCHYDATAGCWRIEPAGGDNRKGGSHGNS